MPSSNTENEAKISRLEQENSDLREQLFKAGIALKEAQKASKIELVRRDKLLSAVNEVATIFLGSDDPEVTQSEIDEALFILSDAVGVDRSNFWKNNQDENGVQLSIQIAAWEKGSLTAPPLLTFPFNEVLKNLHQVKDDGSMSVINMLAKDLPFGAVSKKDTKGLKSMLVTPIMHGGIFWGFITFEDYTRERIFTKEEEDIISSGGIMMSTALMRSELMNSLVQAKDEAQRNAGAKSEFLARMSHEIRTPLNAVIGLTTLAIKAKETKKVKQYLEKIVGSSYQLLNIINDVLDMSKIESEKFEIEHSEFSIKKLVDHVSNVVQVKLEEKHQQFVTDLYFHDADMIVSDELRLSQVLINLLNNAIKFTPDYGMICLSILLEPISEDTLKMKAMVKDSGIGISDEQQAKLFKSFEQADGSITRKFGGTGLGLAISKKIIDLMGGEIWVESKLDEGATFTFEIKIDKAIESAKLYTPEDDSPQDKEYKWDGKRLLVVEDIEINREIVIGLLEGTNLEIVTAENGKIALDMIKSGEKFDIVLMDIQMPVMDGLEATRKIREIATPAILTLPIIAMTANAFKEDQETALNAGLNAHIAKPIDINKLLSTIDDYLL